MGFLDGIEGLDSTDGLITLSKTTPIGPIHAKEMPWKVLQQDYHRDPRTPEFVCAVSVMNAALTHKRRWFILTRDTTEKLIRADSNWPGEPEFNNKKWSKYLKFMYLNKILSAPRKIGRVSIYELIHPSLAEYLPNDQSQLQETIEFAEKNSKRATSSLESKNYSSDEEIGSDEVPTKKGIRYFVPDPEKTKWIRENMKFDGTEEDIFGDLEDEKEGFVRSI